MPRVQTPKVSNLKILPGQTQPTPLYMALDVFMVSREAMRVTINTLKCYRKTLPPFLRFVEEQGVSSPDGITPHHVRAFFVSLQRRGLKDTSVIAYAYAVKAFLQFLYAEGIIPEDVMRKVKMPKVDKRILPAFSPDDVKKLLAVCETPRDMAIVLCLLDTGLRQSEFVALDVDDVDLKTGTVRVKRGKGGKGRIVFLGAKARKALLKYLLMRGDVKPGEPLWLNAHGGRLSSWGLWDVLKRLGRRANVQHCHPHTFRRTFALWSLRAGMNVYALQQIMDHSDLSILRRYLALVEQDLADAHRKHGAVDNML